MNSVAVIGGGSFGTALADLLARLGLQTKLWFRDAAQAVKTEESRYNKKYLPDYEIFPSIKVSADLIYCLEDSEWALFAVPSQSLRTVLEQARPHLINQSAKKPIVIACKGIEKGTLYTMAEVAIDVLGDEWRQHIFALSGPSFANEIVQQQPTAVTLAGTNEDLCEQIARAFFCENFRVYTTSDIVGVELGGALKNVIAIAAGAVIGLNLGNNSRAALITRGLSEITRLALAKGANPITVSGLSGLGDLILTCTGSASRNRTFGELLGRGITPKQAAEEIKQVVEGIETSASAWTMAQSLNIEVSIIRGVYEVVHEGLPAAEALARIVQKEPGKEFIPPK